MNILERFDWTDTLLRDTGKHEVEDVVVDYYDTFATNRMDIGMNTEFKVRLTPKDDRAVYNQSLPMPIHSKEALIIEMALMHIYVIITFLTSRSTQVLFLRSGNPAESTVSLWTSEKLTVWLRMTILTIII